MMNDIAIEISFENWSCHKIDDELESYWFRKNSADDFCFVGDNGDDKTSVSKKNAEKIFLDLMKIDFAKVLTQASCLTGCDGYRIRLTIHYDMHELSIAIWCLEHFKNDKNTEIDFSEVNKLLKIYNRIEKLAKKVGFETKRKKKKDFVDESFIKEIEAIDKAFAEAIEFQKN